MSADEEQPIHYVFPNGGMLCRLKVFGDDTTSNKNNVTCSSCFEKLKDVATRTTTVLVVDRVGRLSTILEDRPQSAGVLMRMLDGVDFDQHILYLLVSEKMNSPRRYLQQYQRVSRQHQKVFHDFLMDPNNWKYLV